MHHCLLRLAILPAVISLLSTGCIVSKSVDRAFLGYNEGPKYRDHKTAGYLLLPAAFAADLVTLPVQAVLLAIFGDNFPFGNDAYGTALDQDLRFRELTDEQKSRARAELIQLTRSEAVSANTGLVLCEDGQWVAINLAPEARAKLIARVKTAQRKPQSLASAH